MINKKEIIYELENLYDISKDEAEEIYDKFNKKKQGY